MENKNLNSYGYLLNCPEEMFNDVNEIIKDKQTTINWNNFNVGDAFYAENTYRCVMADHVMKRIIFTTEEEYKNEFELKHDDKSNNGVEDCTMYEKFKYFDGGEPFLKPEKPFMLVYESEKDGMSIAWLETEEDMIETIEEVKSYGSTIVDSIEIGSCRDFNVDEI